MQFYCYTDSFQLSCFFFDHFTAKGSYNSVLDEQVFLFNSQSIKTM